MSNSSYPNALPNSSPRRVSQQQYFSRSSADNGMHASPNGNACAQYLSYDDSHGMSAVNGHSTARTLQSSISMQPEHAWVNHNQVGNDSHLTAGPQHIAPTIYAGSVPFPQHTPYPIGPITPATPSAYTDTRRPPMSAPSPMKLSSPSLMHGPPTGQTPATSAPTIFGPEGYLKFRSNHGSTRYRCECDYETQRKSDLVRHREGSKHAGIKHYCSFPNCRKSYTRKHKLEEHERTHS